jgi:hypothetical protein
MTSLRVLSHVMGRMTIVFRVECGGYCCSGPRLSLIDAHSITASQHHSITASQHHSITASQHHSIRASQHHSITASEHHSIRAAIPASVSSLRQTRSISQPVHIPSWLPLRDCGGVLFLPLSFSWHLGHLTEQRIYVLYIWAHAGQLGFLTPVHADSPTGMTSGWR